MRATSWIAFRPLWIAQRENKRAPWFACVASMATRHATDPTRWPSAMQLHRIGIAEDTTGHHLLVDLSATGFGDRGAVQDGRTGACCSFPSWLSQRRGVRPNPRRWGDCAIPRFRSLRASLWPALRSYNCGVCRPAAYRVRGNRRLGDTCMAPRFTGN
jgi:hypothetical protein